MTTPEFQAINLALPSMLGRLTAAASVHTTPSLELPRDPELFLGRTTLVDTDEAAADMAAYVAQRTVAFIGIDSEFRFQRIVQVAKGRQLSDPQGQIPLIVSLAVVELFDSYLHIATFVVDVRRPAVRSGLQDVLDLEVPFVGHFLKAELHTVWSLGLRAPRTLWDTCIAEKSFCLGVFNKRKKPHAKERDEEDESTEVRAQETQKELQDRHLSLVATAQRRGILHQFAVDKDRLRTEFLGFASDEAFTAEQIAYAAEDAIVAARLYLPQIRVATTTGLLNHLVNIEMPWVEVNARIEWNGVRIDPKRAVQVASACDRHLETVDEVIRDQLQRAGIPTPKKGHRAFLARTALIAYLSKKGLIGFFTEGGDIKLDKDHLKESIGRDELIDLVYVAKRIESLTHDCILDPGAAGTDGRVHPQQQQIGADTGRQTTTLPNILGLPGVLRPLIAASDGCGIGEVDLCQIEVGVAGAVYRNTALIDLFNAGDVYLGMMRRYFAADLSPELLALPDDEAKKHPALKPLRNQMKPLTLGIIYWITAMGLAGMLGVSETKAKQMFRQFLSLFPGLTDSQKAYAQRAALRGYAATFSGLRRYRVDLGRASQAELRWMVNMPVQGGAAIAFKIAGIRLNTLYPAYQARMIAVVHDAIVFEAPLNHLHAVAELTRQVLCDAVQSCFPELRPRAEINISHPECWNKDGDTSSLDQWLDDPHVLLKGKGIIGK
jgi:DNA polymerase-1